MKAWLQLVSIGAIAGLLASSCVITSDDGDDGEDGGEGGDESTGGRRPTGGSPATGGRTTGGTGTGGATGGATTGGASTGGATGGSSTGGTINACDVEAFEPIDSCEFGSTDACSTCLSGACCAEIKDCYAEEPAQNLCGYPMAGNPDSEFDCSWACLMDIYAAGDVPTEDDVTECVGSCMYCSLPNLETMALSQCLVDSCLDECLGE